VHRNRSWRRHPAGCLAPASRQAGSAARSASGRRPVRAVARAVRRGRRPTMRERTRLVRLTETPGDHESNKPPDHAHRSYHTAAARRYCVRSNLAGALCLFAQSLEPAFGLSAHIFWRRAAIGHAAFDRVGDRKDAKHGFGYPRLDRLHNLQGKLIERNARFRRFGNDPPSRQGRSRSNSPRRRLPPSARHQAPCRPPCRSWPSATA